MITLSQSQIDKRIRELPLELQDFMLDYDTIEQIENLSFKFGLIDNKKDSLLMLFGRTVMGFISFADLPIIIQQTLGLDQTNSAELSQDLQKILSPYKHLIEPVEEKPVPRVPAQNIINLKRQPVPQSASVPPPPTSSPATPSLPAHPQVSDNYSSSTASQKSSLNRTPASSPPPSSLEPSSGTTNTQPTSSDNPPSPPLPTIKPNPSLKPDLSKLKILSKPVQSNFPAINPIPPINRSQASQEPVNKPSSSPIRTSFNPISSFSPVKTPSNSPSFIPKNSNIPSPPSSSKPPVRQDFLTPVVLHQESLIKPITENLAPSNISRSPESQINKLSKSDYKSSNSASSLKAKVEINETRYTNPYKQKTEPISAKTSPSSKRAINYGNLGIDYKDPFAGVGISSGDQSALPAKTSVSDKSGPILKNSTIDLRSSK